MANSRMFKAALYLMVVSILLLPLRGLAFSSNDMVDTNAGNSPCHGQTTAMHHAPDTEKGGTHDCCDDPRLQHDCAHCFATMAMHNDIPASLIPGAYTQPQLWYESIKSIPLENLYRPPRIL